MAKSPNTFQDLLFKPSIVRGLRRGNTETPSMTLAGDGAGQGPAMQDPSGTFRYDPPGSPLKSTQQVNVDFSQFENHTFFNSAEMKVQFAFEKLVNGFPFDGTRAEYDNFVDSLSGFQRYVLGEFPKSRGYLNFKRQNELGVEVNNFLSVAGYDGVSSISSNRPGTGAYALDLSNSPFTVELQLLLPEEANTDSVIVQQTGKLEAANRSNTSGITLGLTGSHLTTEGTILALVSSASVHISASAVLQKGEFHHVAAVYDRDVTGRLFLYVDGEKMSSSSVAVFSDFAAKSDPLTVASGSKHGFGSLYNFTPTQQLSGAVDELRVFTSARGITDLRKYSRRTIFRPTDGSLRLYYRFNEPSGSFSTAQNQDLILDYSGNGLHTHVQMGNGTFDMSLRSTSSVPVPLTAENANYSPVLFPGYSPLVSLNTRLLTSASQYDYNNPNLITRMIPKHYLRESQFADENGELSQNYGYTADIPGAGRMPAAQVIASTLYLWAETLDDVKLFVDSFGDLLSVDYISNRTISDQLLPFLGKYYGINLSNTFANASMEQYYGGEDLLVNDSVPSQSLAQLQNALWRRILTDLPHLVSSRGTRGSIEAVLRSMGIEPGDSIRFKEYGGSTTKSISDAFVRKVKIAAMLDFSGSLNAAGTLDGSGRGSNRPLILGSYLSGSRKAPGAPNIRGTFVNGVSNDPRDGLMTSGSWTVEGVYKFGGSTDHPLTQSLVRLQSTGSRNNGTANNWLLYNVLAFGPETGISTGSISVFGRPVSGSSASTMKLTLSGVNIFDGKKWYVSFGRTRNDLTGSYVSSSYFLRAGRMGNSTVEKFSQMVEYFNDSGDSVLNRLTGSINASGSFIAIGTQSLKYDSSLAAGGFLNSLSSVTPKHVVFSGKVSNVRFFTKALTVDETLTHIKNFESVGVEDPSLNFNFNTADSGSFARLRVDLSCDQPITKSNSDGTCTVFDFSQNSLHAFGTGFVNNAQIIDPERFDYVSISPDFVDGSAPNKIRVRSYQDAKNIELAGPGVSIAPLYDIPENESPKDDRRFAVEMSSVQALNDDIVRIFSTLDYLDNAIGDPELVFSEEYKKLRHLRGIYFNRLTEKMSYKKFFEFFKWFDNAIGDIIEEMVPYTTDYLGTNFTIESHMLERSKFTYRYSDMYVGIINRPEASVIFLQQFLGAIRKF